MAINIRTKGASGEREIARILNELVNDVRLKNGMEPLLGGSIIFQRNQNQSAVGGHDLSNNLSLAIEIKRQEQLSINAWWRQCTRQAKRHEIPILIFKQNRRPWRVCMLGNVLPNGLKAKPIRVELDLNNFKIWFCQYYSIGVGGRLQHPTN